MPLFMDVHETLPEGATVKDVMGAHKADLETQDEYGVKSCATGSTRRMPRCSA
jgi:hypothetical protein